MTRRSIIRQIQAWLGTRDLVWFGTRGDDIDAVTDIANLSSAFSIIGSYSSRVTVSGGSLEDYSGIRVDLDAHDIDDDPHVDPIRALRRDVLAALNRPSVVFTYRPSTFLSAISFARQGRATYLGMFKDHQSAFEHKPWVETAVADLGLPRVSWSYIADSEQAGATRFFDQGPVILRRSRSSGGSGVSRVDSVDQLAEAWPQGDEEFVSVAPFVDGAIPVNVGAVVWADAVTVHYPSVQLIGIPGLTQRPFGFCGNDFAAAKELDPAAIESIETSARRIGEWMQSLGYRGAFGCDFLVKDGVALFLEVNPRFQGSTHLSAMLSRRQGESCIFTDHLAALIGIAAPAQEPLSARVDQCPPMSHFVQHWLHPARANIRVPELTTSYARINGFDHTDVVLSSRTSCLIGGTLGRFSLSRSCTQDGYSLAPDIAAALLDPADLPAADLVTGHHDPSTLRMHPSR